jgi:hypothetical protein
MENLREKIIGEYFSSWLNKDICIIEKYIAENIKYVECYGPEYNGINQMKKWFIDWNQNNNVLKWDIKRNFICDNIIIVEWYFECEFNKKISGFDGISIIEFNDNNKIISVQEFQSKSEHVFPYD